MILGISVMLI